MNGVRINYLDWGGKGEELLFLNGWGDTAHSFDDIAPRFTNRFRVLAYTQRGFGSSGRPETGYDPDMLVEELHRFLDTQKIRKAHLAGHSAAGYLMTRFAARYPERVRKLVYLDATYDYGRPELAALAKDPPPWPEPGPGDFASLDAYRRFQQSLLVAGSPPRQLRSEALEAQLRDLTEIAPDGTVRPRTPAEVEGKLWEEFQSATARMPLDYRTVRSRALALIAESDIRNSLPAVLSAADRERWIEFDGSHVASWRQKSIERFACEMPDRRIVKMADTHHYLFIRKCSGGGDSNRRECDSTGV